MWYVFEIVKRELFLCFLCGGVVLALALKNKTIRNLSLKDIPLLGITIAAIGILSFNFLQGYYAPRMFYSIIALLYIGIARAAYLCKCEKIVGFTLFIAAIVQIHDAIYTLTSTGT